MPALISILLVSVVGLGVVLYSGIGLCMWLPGELRPYHWLVAPWVGYCVLVVLAQFLTNAPWGITALQSAYLTLALATPVNAYAWLQAHRSVQSESTIGRDVLWVSLLGFAVFLLGVLPLLSYGYTTIIGENWDAEIYMGLGEYLKTFSQSGLAHVAPNPILDTLINPPYSLRTHGFSYFQASLGFLPLSSLDTLAPLLALMRALAVPTTYLFFRLVFRLRAPAALLASAVLGANAFLLWITYNTFGMQVPALGLLPLTVCMAVLALRPSGVEVVRLTASPAAVWGGLLLAGTAVTYHPALTALAAMLGPLFLLLLGKRSSNRANTLLNAAIIVAVGALLSAVSQVKSFEGFLKQYSEKTNGLGLTGFTSPADGLGFSLSFRDLLSVSPGRPLLSLLAWVYSAWGWVALGIALLLIGAYVQHLARGRGTYGSLLLEQVALIGGALLYLLAFVRPLNYPYGWFKALSFVSFLPVGAVTGGLFLLAGILPFDASPPPQPEGASIPTFSSIGRAGTIRRLVPFAAGILMLVPLLATTWLTTGMYWGSPLRYNSTMLEAAGIRTSVPGGIEGNSIFVGSGPNMQRFGRLYNGVLSYFLRGSDLYGHFQTANGKLDRERPDGLYSYTLLHADDDPAEYGVGGATLAWHNPILSLYARTQQGTLDLYHHNFRPDGKYPSIAPGGAPLTLTLAGSGVGMEGFLDAPVGGQSSGPVQFTLGISTLSTSTLRLDWDVQGGATQSRQVVVPPGYTTYRSPNDLPYPGLVRLSPGASGISASPLYIRWVHLEKYAGVPGQEPGVSSEGPGLIVDAVSSRRGDAILLNVGYLNNRPSTLTQTLSLDIYGAGKGENAHFGYWNFDVPSASPQNLRLHLDPAGKALASEGAGTPPPARVFAGTTGDGIYSASLLVYENGSVSEAFNDVFTFTIKGGKLADFKPRSLPPLFR